MTWSILEGDCLDVLRTLEADRFYCCVTSPPYWGLRNYGMAGQTGLEATPAAFVEKLVEVFREVRRVLRPDGTLWLNLGDCYATGAGSARKPGGKSFGKANEVVDAGSFPMSQPNRMPQEGLKRKDLVGAPWRVAFALQADGWYLRQDIIWSKPNPMPESIMDRCTKSHEYLFLLSKSEKYFFDQDAIKEPAICGSRASEFHTGKTGEHQLGRAQRVRPDKPKGSFIAKGEPLSGQLTFRAIREMRNKRSVWTVSTTPYKGAHFATFPQELIEPCILAGAPRGSEVLDPFAGTGTTGVVALKHGRAFTGIELNPTYAALARGRITSDSPLFNQVAEVTA